MKQSDWLLVAVAGLVALGSTGYLDRKADKSAPDRPSPAPAPPAPAPKPKKPS